MRDGEHKTLQTHCTNYEPFLSIQLFGLPYEAEVRRLPLCA